MGHGLVVIYNDKMLEVNKTTNKHSRELYETGSGVVLTIGDGDFSFSAALASSYKIKHRLIATSYDNPHELSTKYPATVGVCLDTLKKLNVPVFHNVDATQLYQTFEVSRIKASRKPEYIPIVPVAHNCSRIIFNFPNLGNLGAQATQIHQDLLKKFFIQSIPLLIRPTQRNGYEYGECHVALRNTPFYQAWDIETIAVSIGYKCVAKDVFKQENYPGYQEMRTNPGIFRSAPPKAEGATIYRFVIDDKYVTQLEKNGFFNVPEVDLTKLNQYQRIALPEEISELEKDTINGTNPVKNELMIIDNAVVPTKKNGNLGNKIKTTHDDTSNLSPYQIVSVRFKDDMNQTKSKCLPIYDKTPPGCIVYKPIYPFCPAPPAPSAPQGKGKAITSPPPKFKVPFGIFTHQYHTLLSSVQPTARNYRVGMEELGLLISTYFGHSNEVKAQLKIYTPEMMVSGALIIQPTRALDYEACYKSGLIPNVNKNEGIPDHEKLYLGIIVGVLAEHAVSLVKTPTVPVKKTIIKKRKAGVHEVTLDDNDDEGKDKTMTNNHHQNKKQKLQANDSIDFNNIPLEMLGDVQSNPLLQIASTHTPYRISYQEKQQLERQKLVEFKQKTMLKRDLWQAQRRIDHCEERGKKPERKDVFLVKKSEYKIAQQKEDVDKKKAAYEKMKAEKAAAKAIAVTKKQ